MSKGLDVNTVSANPIATGIFIECDSLTFNIHGIELKADLPSLEYVNKIEINGIKFVRCKE